MNTQVFLTNGRPTLELKINAKWNEIPEHNRDYIIGILKNLFLEACEPKNMATMNPTKQQSVKDFWIQKAQAYNAAIELLQAYGVQPDTCNEKENQESK